MFTHEQEMYLIEKLREQSRKLYTKVKEELDKNPDGVAVARCRWAWIKADQTETIFEELLGESLSSFYVSEAYREIGDITDKCYDIYYKARKKYEIF